MRFYKLNGEIVFGDNLPGEEIIPNTTDGAYEKHVPVFKQSGNRVDVQIGSVIHPMLDVHYIEWIALETKMNTATCTGSGWPKPERTEKSILEQHGAGLSRKGSPRFFLPFNSIITAKNC